jgi:hypothetical protein
MIRCFVQRKYRSNYVGVRPGMQNHFHVGNDRGVTVQKPIEKPLCKALRDGFNWPQEYSYTSLPPKTRCYVGPTDFEKINFKFTYCKFELKLETHYS